MEITLGKFNDVLIDGQYIYSVSNRKLIDAYRGCTEDNEMKDRLADCLAERLGRYAQRDDETSDETIGRIFENMVNGAITSKEKVADRMARSHRYLQQELFLLFMEYVKKLSEAYEKGIYDGRNEYSCRKANELMESLK